MGYWLLELLVRSWQLLAAVSMLSLGGCVVSSDEAPVDRQGSREVVQWLPELLMGIGSVDGSEDALTQVGQVLIGPDTTLLISQPRSRTILVYDREGDPLRQIGGSGEGPGEFRSITSIGLMANTLYVSDRALGRVSIFTPEGNFVRSRRWVSEAFQLTSDRFFTATPPQVLLPDGTGLLRPGMGLTPRAAMGRGINSALYRTPLLRIDQSSRVIDTVAWHQFEGISVGVPKAGRVFAYATPFSDRPIAVIAPDGSGVVEVHRGGQDELNPTFTVVKVDPEGDTVFARAFEYEPLAVPSSHLMQTFETLSRRRRARDRDAPTSDEIRRAFEAAGHIPDNLVPVTEVTIGQDGVIWLRREAGGDTPVRWEALSPEGMSLGSVVLPADHSVATSSGDLVVALAAGELDVPRVLLYRLRR